MKTIEVDPRVPGIRDEIPFPQAKQCSPGLDFPSCQFSSPFDQKLQRSQERPILTIDSLKNSSRSTRFQYSALLYLTCPILHSYLSVSPKECTSEVSTCGLCITCSRRHTDKHSQADTSWLEFFVALSCQLYDIIHTVSLFTSSQSAFRFH